MVSTRGKELKVISLERALDEMVQRGEFAEEQISLKRPDLLDLYLTNQNVAP